MKRGEWVGNVVGTLAGWGLRLALLVCIAGVTCLLWLCVREDRGE